MTNSYNTQDNKKVSVVFNWLGMEGIHFKQTLNDEDQNNIITRENYSSQIGYPGRTLQSNVIGNTWEGYGHFLELTYLHLITHIFFVL